MDFWLNLHYFLPKNYDFIEIFEEKIERFSAQQFCFPTKWPKFILLKRSNARSYISATGLGRTNAKVGRIFPNWPNCTQSST
jgi:hypothetical protein